MNRMNIIIMHCVYALKQCKETYEYIKHRCIVSGSPFSWFYCIYDHSRVIISGVYSFCVPTTENSFINFVLVLIFSIGSFIISTFSSLLSSYLFQSHHTCSQSYFSDSNIIMTDITDCNSVMPNPFL